MDELFEQDNMRKKFVPVRDVVITGKNDEFFDTDKNNKKSGATKHIENV